MLVAVQLSVLGLYLPPVFRWYQVPLPAPNNHFTAGPHCGVTTRLMGALVMLVAVQLSVPGLYLPPVFESPLKSSTSHPRRSFHCRSTLPCDWSRAAGALVMLVAVQLSVLGLYLPPVFNERIAAAPAPDDHFTAGPDCRVSDSANRGISGGRSRPRIICAGGSRVGNFRKSVDNLP